MNENQENTGSVIALPPATTRWDRNMPAVAPQASPLTMLAAAVKRGMDVKVIEGLMDLQQRWERQQAAKEYAEAVAAFKLNPPVVVKDKDNVQYGSKYASIGNLVNTANAALSPHGLTARWEVDQSEGVRVTCILTHRAGHSEKATMKGPLDDSGKKNALQQIKSTVTYLKIATYEAVTGIAAVDAGDDDGNGGVGMPGDAYDEWQKKIEATTTEEAAKTAWQEAMQAASNARDVPAAEGFRKIYADHKAFIRKAAK